MIQIYKINQTIRLNEKKKQPYVAYYELTIINKIQRG